MSADLRAGPRGAVRRLVSLTIVELLLYRRLGVGLAAAVLSVLWVGVLLVAPDPALPVLLPVALLTDVAALGLLVVPALLVMDETQGSGDATRLTPTRVRERIAVRAGVAVVLALACALPVVVAGASPSPATSLLGVGTSSLLLVLVATAMVAGSDTLTTFLVRSPVVLGPLLVPAVVDAARLADSPVLHASPMTSGLDMMAGDMSWPGLGWQVVWCVALAGLAVRLVRRPPSGSRGAGRVAGTRRHARGEAGETPHPGTYRVLTAVRSLAAADRRGLGRDALLVLLLVGVPLVAVAVRVAGTVGVPWARDRFGVDLAADLPAAWAFAIVIHTPLMLGALAGLLLLEDRDGGLLPALATTRATLRTLLAYRLAATGAASGAAVALGLLVAGATHDAGLAGTLATVVAAAAVSLVPAMLLASLARDRAQGVAVLKATTLPLYLPVGTWWLLESPLRWLAAPVPTAWAAWASWASTPTVAVGFAAGAVAVSALLAVALTRRFLAAVATP